MKTIPVLVLLLVVCFASQVAAQSFYQVEWDRDGIEYNGFLVFFSEDDISMRVGFEYGGGYNVAETEYTLEQGEMEDGTEFVFFSGEKSVMLQAETVSDYSPDHLIWVREAGKWDGPYTLDDEDLASGDDFDLSEVNIIELGIDDLEREYLLHFYLPDDPELAAMISSASEPENMEPPTPSNQKVNLHLIVAANTRISDIGVASKIDLQNVTSEFQGIAEVLGIGYKETVFSDVNFEKKKLTNFLGNFSPGSNDIVVFLYTGHGFRYDNQPSPYPQLDLRANDYQNISPDNTMNIEDINAAIIAKGARLNLVFADCCNIGIGFSRSTGDNFLSSRTTVNPQSGKLQKLFIESGGNLLVAAASKGEYSWCSSQNGGFFTSSLIAAMRQEISYLSNDEPRWEDILTHTMSSAKKKSELCGNCSPQNGIYLKKIRE